MTEKINLEIFKDSWKYGELPRSRETKQELDYPHMAAMGSCFARNLTRWLNFQGYTNREMPWDILYNPFSIQKEIERIYTPIEWEPNILHELSSDGQERFRDPWRTWIVASTEPELKTKNNEFDKKVKEYLTDSSCFLITLGLSEVWSPADNPNVVLNQVPVGSIRMNDKKWVSKFASVEEVYKSLETTTNIIRKNITKTGPIILTLSPVPLKYTASETNIREANNLSKSTLLVALKQFTTNRSDVDYFPSYEIVQALTEKSNNFVWQVDGRHVSAQVVETVSTEFTQTYYGSKNIGNKKEFWVPRVDKEGKVIGKLYIDGKEE